jgi:hypothetical protein
MPGVFGRCRYPFRRSEEIFFESQKTSFLGFVTLYPKRNYILNSELLLAKVEQGSRFNGVIRPFLCGFTPSSIETPTRTPIYDFHGSREKIQ